jgi:L-2-hydroxyglutarate oxidase LhgO
MFKVEAVVIGAGVIGLAIARALTLRGVQVIVLEKETSIGTGTSSRNSEVIHSGIYYDPGSLKARLCVLGRRALYAYCDARGIPHRQCGKLIVATEPEEDQYLNRLRERAAANGVEDVDLIGSAQLKDLEPEIRGSSALMSPCTGIVDSHALMQSFRADIEAADGTLALRAPVLVGAMAGRKIHLRAGLEETAELETDLVVNAAGLEAWAISSKLSGLDPATIPPRYLAKGSYFTLAGAKNPFRRLIYPVPEPGGLGVHLTFDLAGQARFGPDVEWVTTVDYAVDHTRSRKFYAAVRRYWPGLPDGALVSAYAGIRPKTATIGSCDFVIQGPDQSGQPGYIALYGIESPGLTASLAIADYVTELAGFAPGATHANHF